MAKILVVDDDLANNVVISKALTSDGHTTRTAFTGEEGLKRFATESFELLITEGLKDELRQSFEFIVPGHHPPPFSSMSARSFGRAAVWVDVHKRCRGRSAPLQPRA